MTPAEFWRIHECKRPRDASRDYAGRLSEDDVAELWEMMDG